MLATPEEQAYYLSELNHIPSPHTRILTPEEQSDARDEIDYLIDMHGPAYVWGEETAMEKARGIIVVVPSRIAEGLANLASNPTVVAMNEKAKAMNARLCDEEAMRARQMQEKSGDAYSRRTRRKPPLGGGGLGGGINLDFGDDHL